MYGRNCSYCLMHIHVPRITTLHFWWCCLKEEQHKSTPQKAQNILIFGLIYWSTIRVPNTGPILKCWIFCTFLWITTSPLKTKTFHIPIFLFKKCSRLPLTYTFLYKNVAANMMKTGLFSILWYHVKWQEQCLWCQNEDQRNTGHLMQNFRQRWPCIRIIHHLTFR